MIPDFLEKIGIQSVDDNLNNNEIALPPANIFASLFTDEFLRKIKGAKNDNCVSREINDIGNK